MAYCTLDDVRGLNPRRTYDATTQPTAAQVEAHISSIAAEMDSVLASRGVTTPITEPTEFVAWLKLVNAQGAAAIAELGSFPEQMGPGDTGYGYTLWRSYQSNLKLLQAMPLPGSQAEAGGPRSHMTEHPVELPAEDYPWRKPRLPRDKEY